MQIEGAGKLFRIAGPQTVSNQQRPSASDDLLAEFDHARAFQISIQSCKQLVTSPRVEIALALTPADRGGCLDCSQTAHGGFGLHQQFANLALASKKAIKSDLPYLQ